MEEETLEQLERLAERDPADRRALERLDAACRARGWTLFDRSVDDWVADLRRKRPSRWGADDPERILGGAGIRATWRLIQAFWSDPEARRRAARLLGGAGDGTAGFQELLRGLEAPDPSIRAAAAEGLGQCRAEAAVPRLLARLDDEDRKVRSRAIGALGRLGSEALAAVPALIGLLADERLGVDAAFSLGTIGGEAPAVVDELIEAAGLGLPGARAWAVAALGLAGDERTIPVLLEALGSYDQDVRRQAAQALREIGTDDESVRGALRDALDDWAPSVRTQAAVTLAGLGERSSSLCSALAEAIEEGVAGWSVREALDEMGAEAAAVVPALLAAVERGRGMDRVHAIPSLVEVASEAVALPVVLRFLEDPNPAVRSAAAHAVGRFDRVPEAAIAALVRALEDPDTRVAYWAPSVLHAVKPRDAGIRATLRAMARSTDPGKRVIAIDILGSIGEDRDALLAAMDDPFERVRFDAAYWIADLRERSERWVDALRRALADSSARVRREGAWGLSELGTDSAPAIPSLLEALRDDDRAVRNNAAYALGDTGCASESVVRALVRTLSDADGGAALSAARSLWVLEAEREAACARIVQSLRDDRYGEAALRYVRELGIDSSVPR